MAARISITENQARLFNMQAKKVSGVRRIRTKKQRENLPENIVERQILDFLRTKGFTVTRQLNGTLCRVDPKTKRVISWIRVGPKNVPDWRAERPIYPGGKRIDAKRNAVPFLSLQFEVKAPGEAPRPGQLEAIRKLNETGTPATWADSIDSFVAWWSKLGFEHWIV